VKFHFSILKMINFTKFLLFTLLCLQSVFSQSQYNYDYQYYEADRNYGGRRQDVLQGQIVDVRQQKQRQQQQQQEEDAELVDNPVPVVIKGLQILPSDDPDYDYADDSSDPNNKPAFSFDNDTTMNLDGPGYALSLLLIGEIVILAMAFFAGGLGSGFGGRSLSNSFQLPVESVIDDLGHGFVTDNLVPWLTSLARPSWSSLEHNLDYNSYYQDFSQDLGRS